MTERSRDRPDGDDGESEENGRGSDEQYSRPEFKTLGSVAAIGQALNQVSGQGKGKGHEKGKGKGHDKGRGRGHGGTPGLGR